MPDLGIPSAIARAVEPFSAIHAIVSPPRCSSTAFARVFWEHPAVRFYSHEPFEVTYYMRQGLDEVAAKLASPLDLERLECCRGRTRGRRLVIKEMPYQVGRHFPILVGLTTPPLLFLLRDPRLSIASRMAKKREVGDDPIFPRIESGWELLRSQVEWCREQGVDHVLVESRDLRNRPLEILPELFARLELPFTAEMLAWRPSPAIDLDNLEGRHRHLYGQVLASSGLRPDTAPVPPLDSFPEKEGWRGHVARCVEIYRELAGAAERLRPAGAATAS